ncbi:MAG: indole-3-glycerol phosphate synthase TrpC [Nitrospirales bacterium]|nr:indole-3-glycerol phosphate synthase TrpC [Nitrospirales bacterium]
MNVLTKIVQKKAERLKATKTSIPLAELKARLADREETRDFSSAVKRKGKEDRIRLIAEIKKASPSKGLIRPDFDPRAIASLYEKGPVSAISVLTEEDFFQGSLSFVPLVKDITRKPVLRKEFIFDEYQVYESRANRADAILLIAAILEKSQASDLLHLAGELGLHVLFEVHDEPDLEKALEIGAGIIGINNRNLKTLEISLTTTYRLKRDIPEGRTVVSESGIRTREDVLALEQAGVDAILVGTSIMASQDIPEKLRDLMG